MASTLVSLPAIASKRPRVSFWVPPALIALAIVSRIPLRGHMLYHWDSVNFAFALQRFDVAQGQPQAPGYLLYVLLGRVAAGVTGSAQAGYVLLSILGTALATAALYDLGRRLWSPPAGAWAALFLLTSPLFWFYGEVALPHTLDALMVIVSATLCWRVWQGEARLALVLAVWLGLSGGLREQTLVFLLPLAVVACWHLPRRWQAGAAAVLAVTVLAWLLPLLAISGGAARYMQVVSAYSNAFDRSTSIFLGAGWRGLWHNLDKLIRYTLWGWALGIVPAALALWVIGRTQVLVLLGRRQAWLLALWAAPSLLFYTLVHMGQQGLIFVYLPILMLVSGWAGAELARRWRWGGGLLAGCLVGDMLLYLCSPVYLPGHFKVLSEATLRQQDTALTAEMDAVRADLPRDGALLADSWRFPQYYLPQVTVVPYQIAADDETVAKPDTSLAARLTGAPALAWYEPGLDRFDRSPARTVLGPAHNGVRLRILRRGAGERFFITPAGFGLRPAQTRAAFR